MFSYKHRNPDILSNFKKINANNIKNNNITTFSFKKYNKYNNQYNFQYQSSLPQQL